MAEDSFRDFVLDQLAPLPELRARSMFGAHGIYSGQTFFGILDGGRLFFKTNPATQSDYVSRGMQPFAYVSRGRKLTMAYHEVPPGVLENAPELLEWARRAIQVAADSKKTVKPAKRAEPR